MHHRHQENANHSQNTLFSQITTHTATDLPNILQNCKMFLLVPLIGNASHKFETCSVSWEGQVLEEGIPEEEPGVPVKQVPALALRQSLTVYDCKRGTCPMLKTSTSTL